MIQTEPIMFSPVRTLIALVHDVARTTSVMQWMELIVPSVALDGLVTTVAQQFVPELKSGEVSLRYGVQVTVS